MVATEKENSTPRHYVSVIVKEDPTMKSFFSLLIIAIVSLPALAQQNPEWVNFTSPQNIPSLSCSTDVARGSYSSYLENLQRKGLNLIQLRSKGVLGRQFGDGILRGNSDSMTGSVAVALLFVEKNPGSDPHARSWTKNLEDSLIALADSAFRFWVDRAKWYGVNLSFRIIPFRHDSVKAGCSQDQEYLCVDQIMNSFGFTSGSYPATVNAFNTWLRATYGADWAFSCFVFNYDGPPSAPGAGSAQAYAALGGPRIVMRYFPGMGFEDILRHEVAHIFWALDEYSMPGYGGATDTSGNPLSPRSSIPNGNLDQSEHSKRTTVTCIMKDLYTRELCSYTAAHIGWISQVELATVSTSPQGLFFDASKTTYTRYLSPKSFAWARGTAIRLDVPTPQPMNQDEYTFASWGIGTEKSVEDTISYPNHYSFTATFAKSGIAKERWSYFEPQSYWDGQMNQIAIERGSIVWVTTGDRIRRHEDNNVMYFTSANSPIPPGWGVAGAAVDSNGMKWFGTAGGVVSYDNSQWRVYTPSNSGLGSSGIWKIAVDRLGNKWFGSYDNGITKFDGTRWTVYNSSNSGLPLNQINDIAVDRSNNIWIATWRGVTRFDGTGWTTYDNTNSPLSGGVLALHVDKNGYVWAGGNGLWRFDGSGWISLSNIQVGPVQALTSDTSGYLWIGGGGGLVWLHGDSLKRLDASNSIFYPIRIRDIKVDSRNNKWIASDNGLWMYNEHLEQPIVVVPAAPTLASPSNGATGVSTSPTLSWNASSGATSYRLQVSTDSSFLSVVVDRIVTSTSQQLSGLASSTTYYWRVNATNSAGTSNWSSVWSFRTVALSGAVADETVPDQFDLRQNFPNPLNPSTTISFNIPQQSHVKLVVYDVLGREVRTLVDEEKAPGRYTVDFDASNFPSGVYLYRMVAGNFTQVRKMVLVK